MVGSRARAVGAKAGGAVGARGSGAGTESLVYGVGAVESGARLVAGAVGTRVGRRKMPELGAVREAIVVGSNSD